MPRTGIYRRSKSRCACGSRRGIVLIVILNIEFTHGVPSILRQNPALASTPRKQNRAASGPPYPTDDGARIYLPQVIRDSERRRRRPHSPGRGRSIRGNAFMVSLMESASDTLSHGDGGEIHLGTSTERKRVYDAQPKTAPPRSD